MKKNLTQKCLLLLISLCLCVTLFASCATNTADTNEVKLLILPHFETEELSGDYPGEAQFYYENYLEENCQTFELADGKTLYYNPDNGVALCLTGAGKANAAECFTTVLNDSRFDFSKAYILATGCSGGSVGYTTIGDVVIATAVVDSDLGHTADVRDLSEENREQLWFHDSSYDDVSCKFLNAELTDKIYELTKDTTLKTTDITIETMAKNFPDEDWANRMPMVVKGTNITSDNYWKGYYEHNKALYITEYYNCPDPLAVTEMEDTAIADVADMYGYLDRLIVLRGVVNTDVFMNNDTPESLWSEDFKYSDAVQEENAETLDSFDEVMENVYLVAKPVIDQIIAGSF